MKPFGVGLYPFSDEEDPIEVSHDELLALRAFDLVYFSGHAPGRFRIPAGNEKDVSRFLKQYRAGRLTRPRASRA